MRFRVSPDVDAFALGETGDRARSPHSSRLESRQHGSRRVRPRPCLCRRQVRLPGRRGNGRTGGSARARSIDGSVGGAGRPPEVGFRMARCARNLESAAPRTRDIGCHSPSPRYIRLESGDEAGRQRLRQTICCHPDQRRSSIQPYASTDRIGPDLFGVVPTGQSRDHWVSTTTRCAAACICVCVCPRGDLNPHALAGTSTSS